jgi:hypothetical protein
LPTLMFPCLGLGTLTKITSEFLPGGRAGGFYYIQLKEFFYKIYEIPFLRFIIYNENTFVHSIARYGGGTESKSTPPIAFQYSIARFGGGAETGTTTTDEPVSYPDRFHLPSARGHDSSDALVGHGNR